MKFALLIVFAVALLAAAVYFFLRTGQHLVGKDYLGGVIHLVAGLALSRAGVELARLAVLARTRA